ncbi:hypothetical protein BC629DRAFT_1535598 [Irpex lacteus]|nr:hypothetical protein BC629DRAFT_1535598 [Irpex lacteus]
MPPRRAKKPKTIHADNVVSDTGAPPGTSTKKPSGRPTKRVVRGRRAALQQIMSMPMDVFYEICLHLQPKDLLSLARSSKELRSLFMSRKTLFLWKAARLNMPGMPSCPEDMSEPAYASLMFDTHCSNCGHKNSGRIYWRCRVRLCKSCYEKLSIDVDETRSELNDQGLGNMADITDWFSLLETREYRERLTIYGPHVKHFMRQVVRTPIEELQDFLHERKRSIVATKQIAIKMEYWFNEWKGAAYADRSKLREARLEAIKAKLEEMGWQTEVDYLFNENYSLHREFSRLPQVNKMQELTPQGWSKIEKIMIEFMEKVQQSRFADERADVVKHRIRKLKPMVEAVVATIPGLTLSTCEVALRIPEVVNVIDPYVTEFDEEALRQHLAVWIPKYLEKRDQDARAALTALVHDKCGLDPHCDLSALAVGTIFICAGCDTGRSILHALRHHCPRSSSFGLSDQDKSEYGRAVRSALACVDGEAVWDTRAYETGLVKLMTAIDLCGLDVKTATVEDLDQADTLFQARWYIRDRRKPQWFTPVMGWRTAVIGTKQYRANDSNQHFGKATDEQILAARPLLHAAQIELRRSRGEDEVYRCALCPTSTLSPLEAVEAHLRETHGILEPTEHQYLDEHLNVPVAQPVYLVSNKHRHDVQDEHSIFAKYRLFEKGRATFVDSIY